MRVVLVLALCSACVSPRAPTWDELQPSNTMALARQPTSTVASMTTTTTTTARPASSSGALIDAALVEMNAGRARARRQGPLSPLWSTAWIKCVDAIDDAVTRAPLASDLGAFVRARVTLEVELQRDFEAGATVPGFVPRRVAKSLLLVDESVQELRAANAPGTTMAPMPRLDDGDLVLRAPLSMMVVSSPFGRRHDPFNSGVRYHAGVDLDAQTGAPVFASASGIVVYAGPQGGYGRYVVMDHGDGVRTHYAHLSQINVEVAALVIEGDVVGYVGSTGRSTGPHLHFAVTNELGVFLDPLAVLDIPFESIADQVATKP
ncbi:MAG: M23 family metallopeptidase [Deltaproteobacteria bacterium]|nr:M23 family metallopeptidase [Deltaproteobacteria bacterium]